LAAWVVRQLICLVTLRDPTLPYVIRANRFAASCRIWRSAWMSLGRAPDHEDLYSSTRATCEKRLPEIVDLPASLA